MAGLYIHIPFCRSKCIYCDFYSTPAGLGGARAVAVARGIVTEWKARCRQLPHPSPDTVYIGGGTPSALPAAMLAGIISEIDLSRTREFTVEANPEDVTLEWASAMAAAGVNRVSMGVQSLDDEVLRRIGRRHTGRRAREAVDILREAGITNISCDLIYGLPGQSNEDWERDLLQLTSWPVTHLSAYSLTFTPGTRLYLMARRGELTPISDDDAVTRFNALRRIAAEAGFEHYEISNLAREGFRSQHNSTYWEAGGQWLGIGPGAHSFCRGRRSCNPDSIDRWLVSPAEADVEEPETETERINDMILAGLRTSRGLDLTVFTQAVAAGIMRAARRFIRQGLLTVDPAGRFVAIPPAHWLISDSIIRDLLQ